MKNHPAKQAIQTLVVQCIAATFCVMALNACYHSNRVKPKTDTVTSVQDSIRTLSAESDRKASMERFKADKEAKAKWENRN